MGDLRGSPDTVLVVHLRYRSQARCTCGWVGKRCLLLASAKVDAKFYLIEYIHEAKSHEKNREIDWLPFEAAVAKLSFDESQIVLREAERCRRTLGNARTA